MANPFVAEIRLFPFNFAPRGWAACEGQLLPISQNTALFSLLGTTYGGDGRSNFALPDLRGSAAMHQGQGPGLSFYGLGERGGTGTVTLLATEVPVHTHALQAFAGRGTNVNKPAAGLSLADSQGNFVYDTAVPTTPATMAPQTLAPVGSGQPHNNMMPYLTLNFCIALQGVYPQRP
jgi:microcystin-dependent protein